MPQEDTLSDNQDAPLGGNVEDVSMMSKFGPDFWKLDATETEDSSEEEEVEDEEVDSEEEDDSTDEDAEEEEEDSEEPDDEEEEEEDPPAKSDPREALWDKQLQAFQQLTATLQRQVEAASKDGEISAKDAAKIEKTQSRIAALLESKEEFDPFEDSAKGFDAVEKELQERDRKIEALEQRLSALDKAAKEQKQSLASVAFDKQYPHLAGRYEELAEQAATFAEEIVGEDRSEAAEKIWKRLASQKMRELIAASKEPEAQEPPKKKKAKVKAKPRATKPITKAKSAAPEKMSVAQQLEEARKKHGFI